jgi:hypothetical protein
VVERQPVRRGAAVDAAEAVSREERPPGDPALDRVRHPHVHEQPDHVRPDEGARRRVERPVQALDHLRLALPHKHVGAPHGTDVERLVARVQDENLLHSPVSVPGGHRGFGPRSPPRDAHGSRRTPAARAAGFRDLRAWNPRQRIPRCGENYRAIARSTACCSSGESATDALPRSRSFT